MRKATIALALASLGLVGACGSQGDPGAAVVTVTRAATTQAGPTGGAAARTSPAGQGAAPSTGGSAGAAAPAATQPAPDTTRPSRRADVAVLHNAWVPADCQHPAGRLVDFTYPGLSDAEGYGSLWTGSRRGDSATGEVSPVYIDMDGDGSQEIAVEYACSAGGVDWPRSLYVYSAAGEWIDGKSLGDIVPKEHVEFQTLRAEGRTLTANIQAYHGASFDRSEHTVSFSLSGGKLQVKQGAPGATPSAKAPGAQARRAGLPDGAYPGAGGPVPAGSTPISGAVHSQYGSTWIITTPSGNIGCDITDQDVGCGVSSLLDSKTYGEDHVGPRWWVPIGPADAAPGSKGDAPMFSGANGGTAQVVGYGQVVHHGTTVCASQKTGLTCWDTRTGHGALLSKKGIKTF